MFSSYNKYQNNTTFAVSSVCCIITIVCVYFWDEVTNEENVAYADLQSENVQKHKQIRKTVQADVT